MKAPVSHSKDPDLQKVPQRKSRGQALHLTAIVKFVVCIADLGAMPLRIVLC